MVGAVACEGAWCQAIHYYYQLPSLQRASVEPGVHYYYSSLTDIRTGFRHRFPPTGCLLQQLCFPAHHGECIHAYGNYPTYEYGNQGHTHAVRLSAMTIYPIRLSCRSCGNGVGE